MSKERNKADDYREKAYAGVTELHDDSIQLWKYLNR